MTTTVRLWIETTHHVAFRYGGWAHVREAGGVVAGWAEGERNTTAARIDLLALIAALEGLPPGVGAEVRIASPSLLAAGRLLQTPPAPQDAPTEDLDLWAKAIKAAAGRALVYKAAVRAPQTPAAFLHAWAEVGQDKAKTAGRFRAAIPKVNLSKLRLDP
jgi:hypothetical protein